MYRFVSKNIFNALNSITSPHIIVCKISPKHIVWTHFLSEIFSALSYVKALYFYGLKCYNSLYIPSEHHTVRKVGNDMAKNTRKDRSNALYDAILDLKDAEEARRFFEDLCTPTEQRSMEQRFDVAKMLLQNKVYTEILEKTGTSSATISRVRRTMIDQGARGAVRDIVLRLGMADDQKG